jgi:hypothetical protein
VQAKKKLKDAYFAQWDRHEHLTAFGKQLDDDQTALIRSDITVSDEDKLQFYLEQMYDSNMFEKAEMMEWEQQPINIKTDYALAKNHFELKVKAHDTYIQNSSSGATGHNKYESANNMANIGDEIKDYIAQMASASVTNDDVVANMREADKKIKPLTVSIAKLASRGQQNTENDNPNKNRGCRGDRIVEQMTKLRNMGRYCSTHGFHPVGPTHDSVTCQFKKKDEHNDAATWNNRLNGNTYWLKAIHVTTEQQNHPTWKGKDKPI